MSGATSTAMDAALLARLYAAQRQGVTGWDFSALAGMSSDPLPWDYETIARAALRRDDRLLDMDTGGGEVLLRFDHPPALTTVTETYPPNVALCRQKLAPLGVNVVEASGEKPLPFESGAFDTVLNRHGSFLAEEIFRILAPGGRFITQQVGGENNSALSRRLIADFTPQFAGFDLDAARRALTDAGLTVTYCDECFPELRFYDMETLVRFCRVIEWEFPGFSVDSCHDALNALYAELLRDGCIKSREHRFVLTAMKG